jgi:peroxiredoxin
MIRFGFFFITFFQFTFLQAQEDIDFFTRFAGDSAININKNLLKKDIGDTVKLTLSKGLNRIVFNKGIYINDGFDLKIISSTGQIVDFIKNDGYIDIYTDSLNDFSIIMTTEKEIEKEVIGMLFWVYNINIKRDAPDFNLQDINGNVYTSEKLLGKIVVFNFWGIWCKPCRMEIPRLNNLVNYYSYREDIVFLAVSGDPVKKLKKFVRGTEFAYNLVSVNNATELSTEIIDLSWIAVPSHAVINKSGEVVFQFLGDHPEIEQLISKSIEKYK